MYKLKKKKRKLTAERYMEVEKENEKNRERRHQERLEVQKEAIQSFNNAFEKLMDKLK